MSAEPYRATYRVERRTRELTAEERASLDQREHESHGKLRTKGLREASFATLALGAPVVAVVALIVTRPDAGSVMSLAVCGACAALLLGVLVALRRSARASIATVAARTAGPPGGWRVQETHVFARSLVYASNDGESTTRWLLFEIPGGDWFAVEAERLVSANRDFARAEVELRRLWPNGMFLEPRVSGGTIPCDGGGESHEDFLRDAWAGRVLNPDTSPVTADRVAESTLPAWVRAAVRS